MAAPLAGILRKKRIATVFHPIVDTQRRSVYGYEALSRGPAHSSLERADALFAAAREGDCLLPLEALCLETALRRYRAQQLDTLLFVNLSPPSAIELAADCGLRRLLESADIAPHRIVVELTEQTLLDDQDRLTQAVASFRALGCQVAIDDLGSGYSSLRAWLALRPDFVKLDRSFVSDIDHDTTKVEFLHFLVDLSRAVQSRVIAEGVETQAEHHELVRLGIELQQGFLFSRPAADARPPAWARLSAPAPVAETYDPFDDGGMRAGDLAVGVAPIDPEVTVQEVVQRFRDSATLNSLAIVEDRRPVGIVRRAELFLVLSRPLHPELYGRKPISTLMERMPLCIDSRLRLEQASRMLTRTASKRIPDDFIITDNGEYLGLGETVNLLRQITAQQLRTVKHSNPLTLLPGNVLISDCITRLIARDESFVACYVDLDNFKPFNDCYGYARGDDVLRYVAQLIKQHINPRVDFVGHVGGDDFFVVFRSDDWRQRLVAISSGFAAVVPEFYDPVHRESNGITACDRYGKQRHFPLLSMSIAAMDSSALRFSDADELAAQLAGVKTEAKRVPGNSLLLRTRDGLVDLIAA